MLRSKAKEQINYAKKKVKAVDEKDFQIKELKIGEDEEDSIPQVDEE